MRISILGSGTGIPSAERGPAGFAVTREKDLLLVDCGSGSLSTLAPLGLDYRRIGDGAVVHLGWADAAVAAVPHGNVRANAYRIAGVAGATVFSGDCSPSLALADLARGADLLVSATSSWCATSGSGPHLTAGEAGHLAQVAGVSARRRSDLDPLLRRSERGGRARRLRPRVRRSTDPGVGVRRDVAGGGRGAGDGCGGCAAPLTSFGPEQQGTRGPDSAVVPGTAPDSAAADSSLSEAESKVVTILFADVARFTALAETLDPEEVRAR